MRKRLLIPCVAIALYAVLMAVTWSIGSDQARRSTETQLDYAILDFRSTVGGAIDTMLGHVAKVAVSRLGGVPSARSLEEMAALARDMEIDEMNVVNAGGEIIASNDPLNIGVQMAGDPVMNDFMALTNGVAASISQPFRPNTKNPKMRAKYLAVAFPGGNGFVQVGMDEKHLSTMLPRILGYIFDEWLLGKNGFFLCANAETGALISNPANHRDEARTLAETGFDLVLAEPFANFSNTDPGKTLRQEIFGETCYCRYYIFGGHRFVAALPAREFYSMRAEFVFVLGVLLFIVLAIFAYFTDRIMCDSARLRDFYRAEDERRCRDFTIARMIQSSALPTPLADHPSFKLHAFMRPAREVGGDFYDFFMLDSTHVAFLVADVSGKGVTAALYMMTTKTLIKDAILSGHDPATAITKANNELCKNNPASMFLTVWAGVLDIKTGELTYVNAGHNPPVSLPDDIFIDAKSGPVLAFTDGHEYISRTLRLSPGETLFLYTDGVTEAIDMRGGLFGEERLLATLDRASEAEPREICEAVTSAVDAFARDMPQADDITMLAIRYIAPPCIFSRSFAPVQASMADASEYLDETLRKIPQLLPVAHIILDEIGSNIIKHSGASVFEVDIEILSNPSGIRLTFIDDGSAYNPLSHIDPDTSLSAEERPIGGLGILMVKKLSNSIAYNRVHNRNFLIVTKLLG